MVLEHDVVGKEDVHYLSRSEYLEQKRLEYRMACLNDSYFHYGDLTPKEQKEIGVQNTEIVICGAYAYAWIVAFCFIELALLACWFLSTDEGAESLKCFLSFFDRLFKDYILMRGV